METTYNRVDLQAHLELIKPAGFSLESFEDDFYFTKHEVDRKIIIKSSHGIYFPSHVNFNGVILKVIYHNVEQIFNEVYINNTNVYFKHILNETTTFNKSFYSVLSQTDKDKLKTNEVYDDSSFFIIKSILEQMINAALSFLNQNQTLQSFYDLGETMPIIEQANFYSQPLPERKLIIKKILNKPDYNSYASELINYHTQEGDIDEVNFLQALKAYLDNL